MERTYYNDENEKVTLTENQVDEKSSVEEMRIYDEVAAERENEESNEESDISGDKEAYASKFSVNQTEDFTTLLVDLEDLEEDTLDCFDQDCD
jgi:hypothetical protein